MHYVSCIIIKSYIATIKPKINTTRGHLRYKECDMKFNSVCFLLSFSKFYYNYEVSLLEIHSILYLLFYQSVKSRVFPCDHTRDHRDYDPDNTCSRKMHLRCSINILIVVHKGDLEMSLYIIRIKCFN